jgi:hypothetical protein
VATARVVTKSLAVQLRRYLSGIAHVRQAEVDRAYARPAGGLGGLGGTNSYWEDFAFSFVNV